MATGTTAPHVRVARPSASREANLSALMKGAGLRYVCDDSPGIHRVEGGKSWRYVGPDGWPIHDDETLTRIRALAIPPAWTELWICPRADGHIQATGRDAKGRKQYRYQARWRFVRDEAKYGRTLAFGQALAKIGLPSTATSSYAASHAGRFLPAWSDCWRRP